MAAPLYFIYITRSKLISTILKHSYPLYSPYLNIVHARGLAEVVSYTYSIETRWSKILSGNSVTLNFILNKFKSLFREIFCNFFVYLPGVYFKLLETNL